MTATTDGDTRAPVWLAAVDRLDEMQRTAEVLALLRGAHRDGLLALLTTPVTADVAAGRLGIGESRVSAALSLLASYGVVKAVDGAWTLTDPWQPLVVGQAPISFEGYLGMGRVRAQQFEASLSTGHDYWQLDAADRLLVARGVSPDPTSPAAAAFVRSDLASLPDVVAALDSGGRVLELGCGVGGRLSAMMRAFPSATGVGVELSPELAAFGRRRAEDLGVADRLSYVVADAAAYEPEGLFDLVTWSQFFFPEHTRQAALATARRALRPGGWISMPVIWDGTAFATGSAKEQELSAERLLLDLWRVPLRTTDEVRAEVEAAGFSEIRIDESPVVHIVRARRPADSAHSPVPTHI